MKIIVQKYGGSSVADAEKIKNVAVKISKKVKEKNKLVVVVSAMGKTTDNLIKLSKEVSKMSGPRELDMLLTTGEQVSASLLAMDKRHRDKEQVAKCFPGKNNDNGRLYAGKD